MSFNLEKIPKELIDDCNDKHQKTGIPHLILDVSDKFKIYRIKGDTSMERESKIDTILDSKFEVVSWYELLDMPSRQTFYDSVTKNTNLFERHKFVLKFLNSLDFSITDLLDTDLTQQEILYNCFNREVSYIKENSPIIIRIKPNLMAEINISGANGNFGSKRHFFFYNPDYILNIIFENSDDVEKRNLKISHLLETL